MRTYQLPTSSHTRAARDRGEVRIEKGLVRIEHELPHSGEPTQPGGCATGRGYGWAICRDRGYDPHRQCG